ncbi:alpha/beta hydrolase family protein [Microbacterium sp. NPDC056044]|uniref:alpha/beta hydrolase family protein n=1 Tax=Microbacterium sp. NPDC056044 TaxID=3345690 RepID=UPI0035D7B358
MLGAVAASALGVGAAIARRLTAPPGARTFDLLIRGVEIDDAGVVVVLDRTRQTVARGSYTLLFEGGGWAQLGADVVERGPDRVARRVTKLSAGLAPAIGDRVSWSGIYYMTPAEADLDAGEVRLSINVGDAPAWLIEGESSGVWAIHIHGMGSSRSGPVRGARAATTLGYTSLVVTYRNDGEGPWLGNRRSTLGSTEVDDVAVAVQYAVDHGAKRIVLFGWSMGAAIALQLAAHPTHSVHVDALVLESPVLDWIATVKANCARAGLPAVAGWLAVPWLSLAPLARASGLAGPIPLGALNWIARASELTKPTLILHGTRDDSAPIDVARTLAGIRPDLVRLNEFDAAHTMTWNSDPERWQTIVSDWLTSRNPSV